MQRRRFLASAAITPGPVPGAFFHADRITVGLCGICEQPTSPVKVFGRKQPLGGRADGPAPRNWHRAASSRRSAPPRPRAPLHLARRASAASPTGQPPARAPMPPRKPPWWLRHSPHCWTGQPPPEPTAAGRTAKPPRPPQRRLRAAACAQPASRLRAQRQTAGSGPGEPATQVGAHATTARPPAPARQRSAASTAAERLD